ncbi:MAG TPA: BatD family protein [Verrucomicrobiae bacterium]|nr:BatD family protein [Verrucomicrobiae bacterium]
MAKNRTNSSTRNNSVIHAAGARRFTPVAAVLAVCLFFTFTACAANFSASLDRGTIMMGETATLSLTFEGGQPGNVPTPQVPGLQISHSGDSSNVSWVNGQMSTVFTVTFSVTPDHAGDYWIPAMQADLGGQRIQTQPIKLTVTPPGSPSSSQINDGSQIAFMRFNLPDKKVYPGEMIAGQLQIFIRDDAQNPQGLQLTAMPADGFTVGKMSQGSTERARIGDHMYSVVPISIALTAVKTGALSVGPISASIVVFVNGENGNWGPFGGFFGGQQKQVTMATDPVSATSVPLPSVNVPPDFNGAVGDYTMSVNAGPTNIAVGDPVTVRVQISGRGSFDSISLPSHADWHDFKIFTPTSKTETSDGLGDEGSKTFEEIVTPENANIHELPPISFSFFNPDDGNYHTLTQQAMPLLVTSAGATPVPTVAGTKPENQTPQPPQDIVSIRENLGALAQGGGPLIARPAFLALQGVPVVAFIAALVWRRRTDNLANNPRLRRRLAVQQLIAGGLDDLNKFAAENKSNEFFATLFRLLQEELGERLDCPAISITEADADERLAEMGAKPETLNSLRELFQACNQARYARVQTSQELSALASKFENAVSELQELNV